MNTIKWAASSTASVCQEAKQKKYRAIRRTYRKDNEQGPSSSETTDDDGEYIIPLKSQVVLTVEQRMAKQQDVTIVSRDY